MIPSSLQQEPTMEELLASIRKIIADDMGALAEPQSSSEVIEVSPEAMEQTFAATKPVAAGCDFELASAFPAPEDAANPLSDEETAVNSPVQATEYKEIFSEKTRQAIDDTFANLDGPVDQPEPESCKPDPAPFIGNGHSLEAVFQRAVRESLGPLIEKWMDSRRDDLLASAKPAIREWMDDHFPALLEGAVREEVARVVKARGGRR